MADSPPPDVDDEVATAAKWLDEADAILLCAGAGASIVPGSNVYGSAEDFATHYPHMEQWGYHTAYECMGLSRDPSVPPAAKWGFWLHHFNNMRWAFPIAPTYKYLYDLVVGRGKDYFVLTSNVDGCFRRSGFDPDRIYTPQGEMDMWQCRNNCQGGADSVWPCRPYLDELLPQVDPTTGLLDEDRIPVCPHCQGPVNPNLRGGDWFVHAHLEAAQDRFREWVTEHVSAGRTVAILEIGAGFNTPVVTRFPMESIARQLGARGRFVRLNYGVRDSSVPPDLPCALGLSTGTGVLEDIRRCVDTLDDATQGQAATEGDAKEASKDSTDSMESTISAGGVRRGGSIRAWMAGAEARVNARQACRHPSRDRGDMARGSRSRPLYGHDHYDWRELMDHLRR